jgi:hypothetical protein
VAIRQAGLNIAIAFREKHGAFGFRISVPSTVAVFDCEIASLGRAWIELRGGLQEKLVLLLIIM